MKNLIITISTLLLISSTSFAYIFSDIDTSNYYLNSTQYLYINNIIKGYSDGSFQTEKDINRAETLKILLEGNNIDLTESEEDCFYDVNTEEWFSPYVCTAKELGIVHGYPDKTFKPEQTVNKVEALKMIGQVYEWGVTENENESWYLPYITYAENKNLIPETELNTENSSMLSRGSLSEIIYRLLVVNDLEIDLFTTQAELEIQNQIAELKTKISNEDVKIILTWFNKEDIEEEEEEEELDIDLDLYLTTTNNEEISYRRKISSDQQILFEAEDNKETIYINELEDGNYELFVTSNRDFSTIEGKVEIYASDELIKTYSSEESEYSLWKILNILNASEILNSDQYGDCKLIQKENSYCD